MTGLTRPLLVCVMLLLALPVMAQSVTLDKARVSSTDDKTRIVLELTRDVEPDIFTIDEPQRVVIDLPDTESATDLTDSIPTGRLIEQVRTGEKEDNRIRIVLELGQEVDPESFIISPDDEHSHHRLVLDLHTADKPKNKADRAVADDASTDEASASKPTVEASSSKTRIQDVARTLPPHIQRQASQGQLLDDDPDTTIATVNIVPPLKDQTEHYRLNGADGREELALASLHGASGRATQDKTSDDARMDHDNSHHATDTEFSGAMAASHARIDELLGRDEYQLSNDNAGQYQMLNPMYHGHDTPSARRVLASVKHSTSQGGHANTSRPTADDSAKALAQTSSGGHSKQAHNQQVSHQSTADKQRAGKPVVIAIDPGHGGRDTGARGPSGILEKNVTLSIARRLKNLIDNQSNMQAVMTRSGDRYVALRQRMETARRHDADLFISIHADAVPPGVTATGSSVYALSPRGASSEQARWLAHRENNQSMAGGASLKGQKSSLASFVLDMSQGASVDASMDAGKRVLTALGKLGPLHRSTVQRAGFMVLKSPDIPSILVETNFITNQAVERKLNTAAYQDQLAAAIMSGIKGYFSSYRPSRYISKDGKESGDEESVSQKRGHHPQANNADIEAKFTVNGEDSFLSLASASRAA